MRHESLYLSPAPHAACLHFDHAEDLVRLRLAVHWRPLAVLVNPTLVPVDSDSLLAVPVPVSVSAV
jgi:hypothetical protein